MLPGVSKVTWRKDSSEQHKKARNFKKPKGNNEQVKKCDRCGYNAHKPQKKVQPRMNRVISAEKLDTLPKCAEVGKVLLTC